MANLIPKFEYEHPVDGTTTITLELPPEGDPLKEKFPTKGKETRSNNGKTQYQRNFTDHNFSLTLVFLTKAKIDELQKLFDDFASDGNEFKYFPSSDEIEFFNVVWPGSSKVFDPVRVIASAGDFIYDLKFPLRVE